MDVRRWLPVAALIAVVAIGAFVLWRSRGGEPASRPVAVERPRPAAMAKVVPPAPVVGAATPMAADVDVRSTGAADGPAAGRIVLVIDDIGYEGQPLDRAAAIDPDITFAVLPNGNRSVEMAARLHQKGFEIICPLPMEPVDLENSPGRNAVLTSMSDEEIAQTTSDAISTIRYARGVNNHMGSRATADRRVMRAVLEAVPQGLYFIDSVTVGNTVAGDVARELNIPTASRHVFLDGVQEAPAIRRRLGELAAIAADRGLAVGIAHPHDVTVRVLEEEIPRLRQRGFDVVRASQAVR